MENLSTFAPNVEIPAEDAPVESPQQVDAPVASEAPETPDETAAVGNDEEKQQDNSEKPAVSIPLAKYVEAREQAKRFREQAERVEREAAERFAQLEAKLAAIANPPKPVPSFDENPAEYLRHQTEELARKQREFDEMQSRLRQQTEEQTRAQAFVQQVTTQMQTYEDTFRQQHPDYDDAVAYLQQVADQNLLVAGVDDPATRKRIAWEQSLQLTANAMHKGQNPAEVAYKFAKNYGYRPKADASKVVETAARGTSKTQSLGNGKAEVPFNLQQLANMDDDEFNNMIADDSKWRKMIRQG